MTETTFGVIHPGYDWGFGPTTGWKHADGPWHWVVYSAPAWQDRCCARTSGFCDSAGAAEMEVLMRTA